MPSNYVYDIGQGLNAAAGGFMQGMQMRRQNDEYDRRVRAQDAQMKRQSVLDARADEEAAYQKGLRPMRERVMDLGVQSQEQALENSQLEHDKKLQDMAGEGLADTMRYLDAGMPQEAARAFNSSGTRRTQGFRPHPTKKGIWIGTDEEGNEGEIDPKSVLNALGKAQKPIELNYRSKLITPDGKVIADNPEAPDGEGNSITGMKATNAYKLYQEIRRLHPEVPEQLAFAKAYDMIEKTTDPMGFGASLTDISTGQNIGSIGDVPSGYKSNPDYPTKDNRPRSGKDGNFYVPDPQRPGKYLRVDPDGGQGMEPPRRRLPTPEARAAETARAQVPSDPAAQQMGNRFGIPQQATMGQRGDEYRQMAMAVTKVEKDLRQGFLPAEDDLFDALQFAEGQGDQKRAAMYQQILQENYGAR